MDFKSFHDQTTENHGELSRDQGQILSSATMLQEESDYLSIVDGNQWS